MYLNIINGILTGLLVKFSATFNNNSSVFICAHNDENNYTRVYKCSSESPLLQQFSLDKWQHTQKIKVSDDDITVKDELKWSCCEGDRTYKVIKIMDDDFKYVTVKPWSLTTKRLQYRPVVYAMQSKMIKMDETTFNAFLTSIK
jgi:hypothetical protein